MTNILKHIITLRKQGNLREADRWINHFKISSKNRIILLRCLEESNAAGRFEVGSKSALITERKLEVADAYIYSKGFGCNGKTSRRIAKKVLGAKFLEFKKLADDKRNKQ